MLKSQIPAKFTIPFAASAAAGMIRTVPTASQIGIVAGAASLYDGFVPLNATQLASGGIPPAMQDFNGILNQATAWDLWTAAAGVTPYDATFQTAIGGYPQQAVVASATTPGAVWLSVVDNNTTNPDTGGAGWVGFMMSASGASTTKAPKLIGVALAGGVTNMPTSTNTQLAMSATQSNLYGTSTFASSTFTVGSGESGLYFISAFCWFSTSQASFQAVSVRVNGNQSLYGTSNPGSGNGGVANISGVLRLNVGDQVTFYGYQQSGATYNTQACGASIFLISSY